MKFMFVGDLHANLDAADRVAELAKDYKCDEIIQVGDWGFIWSDSWKAEELSEVLKGHGIPMRFCDGNHDNHPELFKAERNKEENILPFLTYQHRGTLKEFSDGTKMVFLGGAPSIDRRFRQRGYDWWETEYITEEDVKACLEHKGISIDVLVTHDAASRPPGIKETSDVGFNYRAEASHDAIKAVLRALKPALQIHGHYHRRVCTWFEDTKVIGLDADINDLADLFYIYERCPVPR